MGKKVLGFMFQVGLISILIAILCDNFCVVKAAILTITYL